MITLYFVRHGQTVWNESGRYQGSTEVALSALGKEQAKLTAHWSEWNNIQQFGKSHGNGERNCKIEEYECRSD